MRRLFYKGVLKEEIEIEGADAHHLKTVNRAKLNDEITVVDDVNTAARMQIAGFTDNGVLLKLVEKIPLIGESKTKLTLALALLKGDKTDTAAQKATELGVSRIIPLITERVVVKLDEEKRKIKRNRLEKIATEAAKQSGGLPPEVFPIISLDEFLKTPPKNLIFFYENEENVSLKDTLSNVKGDDITLLIGAEGGFSASEAENIIKNGGAATTLGRRILRAETAAITAVALTMYERGELR